MTSESFTQSVPDSDTPDSPIPTLVRLSALRDAHGLTLQEVCDRSAARGVPIDKSFLSLLERGKRRASPKTLRALAAVYGLKPLDIYQPEPCSQAPVKARRKPASAEPTTGRRTEEPVPS